MSNIREFFANKPANTENSITQTPAEQLTEIIMQYYAKVKPIDDDTIKLPINSIDNVICDCLIRIVKYEAWHTVAFIAESKYVHNENGSLPLYVMNQGCKPNNDFKIEVSEFCRKLFENLSKLKLSINGNLSINNEDTEIIALHNIFGNIQNIKLDNVIESCCVCYNLTLTKTPCKHPLCHRCWFSICKEDDNDDIECLCPLCREDILHI